VKFAILTSILFFSGISYLLLKPTTEIPVTNRSPAETNPSGNQNTQTVVSFAQFLEKSPEVQKQMQANDDVQTSDDTNTAPVVQFSQQPNKFAQHTPNSPVLQVILNADESEAHQQLVQLTQENLDSVKNYLSAYFNEENRDYRPQENYDATLRVLTDAAQITQDPDLLALARAQAEPTAP
jgi:hypothetical protein